MHSAIINKSKNRQKGMTGLGWMIVLGMVAFFAVLAMRAFPIYSEGFKVKSALESLKGQPGITKKTKSQILKLIFSRFDIDDVSSILREDIFIEKRDDVLTITIDFEIRNHVMGNMDMVGVFHEEVEVIAN